MSVFIGDGPFEAFVASDNMARRTFSLARIVSLVVLRYNTMDVLELTVMCLLISWRFLGHL